MKNYLKTIIFIIIVCMTLTFLLSCNNNNTNNKSDSTTGANSQDTTTDQMLRENTPDSLPADLNFNGQEIRILHRDNTGGFEDWNYEISVDNQTGDIVNDAIYNRNQSVEDRLNVKITSIGIPGDYGNMSKFINAVRSSVNSGSDDYDLIAGYAYYIPTLAPEGLLYNLNNVQYLNPKADWWSADCDNQMTIDGKLYYITGDMALTLIRSMDVIFFNKKVAQDLNVGDLYQVVLNGEFTIDKLNALVKDTYKDVNGDGKADKNDMYGYSTSTGNLMNGFCAAFDQPILQKDADGVPQLALNTQKMSDIVSKMYDFLYNNQNVYATPESSAANSTDMFPENRTLFMAGVLYNSDNLRAMESDYGILPMPKWDANQAGYYTVSSDVYSLFCIPVTCTKIDAVGATMEAMCAESYRKVTPAYYEVTLKEKYSRDEETSQMLDIIRSGLKFDFGTVNTINLSEINSTFRSLMEKKSGDFTSYYEANEPKYQTALDKLITQYQSLQ
ncbi:MAG: extracellular solute-binding protein [Oscillospiraceae bacterium]|nr:extracellular solute-binding protein [Oscillospiraceae bacterium]